MDEIEKTKAWQHQFLKNDEAAVLWLLHKVLLRLALCSSKWFVAMHKKYYHHHYGLGLIQCDRYWNWGLRTYVAVCRDRRDGARREVTQ